MHLELHDQRVPSFAALCQLSDQDFYDDATGLHYAQARYLCFYLQEQQLLQEYYRQFHAQRDKDPAGYQVLDTLLRDKIGADWEQRWQSFVKQLQFP